MITSAPVHWHLLRLSALAALLATTPHTSRVVSMKCQEDHAKNVTGVRMRCTTPFLEPDVNISVLPIDRTAILSIKCLSKGFVSSINATTFHQLRNLQRLMIIGCVFEKLPEDAFRGLRTLQQLQIIRKSKSESVLQLPSGLSSDLLNLTALYLEGMGIESFPDSFWRTISKLNYLSLYANNLHNLHWLLSLSEYAPTLSYLDLSYNLLTSLQPRAFALLPSLVNLNVGGNCVTAIYEDTFFGLSSLKTLYLSNNSLSVLPRAIFRNLNNLQVLELFHINVPSLPVDVFKGLNKLRILDLGTNNIYFPESASFSSPFRDLINLQSLFLYENNISIISSTLFEGLENLRQLSLASNDLSNATPNILLPVAKSLQRLDVSDTKSQNLQYLRHFASLTWLQAAGNVKLKEIQYDDLRQVTTTLTFIDLNNANLQSIVRPDKPWGENAIFSAFLKLQRLQLDSNWIERFDYFMIPNSLKHLSLSNNRISSLEDVLSLRSTKKLASLVLNFGTFPVLDVRSFSHSVKGIVCNYCKINLIKQGTFGHLKSLAYLTLTYSAVRHIERFAFSAVAGKPPAAFPQIQFSSDLCPAADEPIVNNIHFVHFYQGKKLKQACQMTRYCQNNVGTTKKQDKASVHLVGNPVFTNSSKFYERFVLDCGCNKIASFNFTFDIANPVNTLYLDGNHIKNLANGSLSNFISLQILFLNNSGIGFVESHVFRGLHELTAIYLNDNELQMLHERQFYNLQKLSTIFLQNNLISTLDYRVFSRVLQLKYINLNHNQFNFLSGFIFSSVQGLLNVTIANNNMTAIGWNSFLHQFNLLELNLENNFLTEFSPRFISATKQLTKLSLNNNRLNLIDKFTFYNVMKLVELHLENNVITKLDPLTFSQLRNLKILHLENNKLSILEKGLFQETHKLEELHLSNNDLTKIYQFDFGGAIQLKKLYIHNNTLSSVNVEALSNLFTLNVLTLHNNRLKDLEVSRLPSSLTYISLSGNDFPCECNFLIPFRNWVTGPDGSNKVNDIDEVICKHNNGTNAKLSIVTYTQKYCETHTSVLMVLLISGGCFVTIIVISVLTYMHRLEMQVWVYSHYGFRFFHRNNDADIGRVYHAFVSYSSDDEVFVAEQLVRVLEPEFRLCVHGRDFPVGAYIIDTVCEVVEKSCRTLMVLSNNFVKSEWCRFEFKIAHQQTMKDRCCRLIVILMEDVDMNELDKELKIYLKTNTYLKWGDLLFWEKLRFAMPDLQRLKEQEERRPLLNG